MFTWALMQRPLNILFITQEDFLAGSTYSVFFLARELASRGHRTFIAARENSLLHSLTLYSKVEFLPLKLTSRFDRNAMRLLRDWVVQYELDIINSQSSKDRYITVFSRWLYRLPVKVVHTRRQISMSLGGPAQNLIYVNGTDKIVAVGNGVKKSLVDKGIPAGHVEVIFNGTPVEKYMRVSTAYTDALRKKLDIKEGDFVIGCISRRKLQHHLLRALDFLGVPAKVVFVGITEDEELATIARGFQLPHMVHYEGSVAADLALSYLPLFSIYALCSNTEGLSQALMEAMYFRVPIVATRASGNDDLIKHAHSGYLYEDGDVLDLALWIKSLRGNRALGAKMADEAHKTLISRFTIEQTANRYEHFFKELLAPLPEVGRISAPEPLGT